VTQLYLSVDAPTKELLKKVDVPLFQNYWERLNESLEELAKKGQRTCIRLTAVKGLNMIEPAAYAALIEKGDPDFVEVKAFMFVGASRDRLTIDNMPLHEEVVAFARDVVAHLPEYDLLAEHIPSRVVLLAKKSYKKKDGWRTWIDFPAYHKLALSGEPFSADDYSKLAPGSSIGISGKGTPTHDEVMAAKRRRKERQAKIKAVSLRTALQPAEGMDETELEG